MRFFQPLTDLSHEELARYCQVDYNREIALVAVIDRGRRKRIIGVGRLNLMPDGESADMAVVVGDPWHGQGMGTRLCEETIMVARLNGAKKVFMDVLRENAPMRNLAGKLGFKEVESDDPGLVRLVLELDEAGEESAGARAETRRGKKKRRS